MSKALEALEALERLKQNYKDNSHLFDDELIEIVEISLIVLQIIIKKAVNIFILLHSGDLETYNDMVEEKRKLAKEEYDLLKKVILWVILNSQ